MKHAYSIGLLTAAMVLPTGIPRTAFAHPQYLHQLPPGVVFKVLQDINLPPSGSDSASGKHSNIAHFSGGGLIPSPRFAITYSESDDCELIAESKAATDLVIKKDTELEVTKAALGKAKTTVELRRKNSQKSLVLQCWWDNVTCEKEEWSSSYQADLCIRAETHHYADFSLKDFGDLLKDQMVLFSSPPPEDFRVGLLGTAVSDRRSA